MFVLGAFLVSLTIFFSVVGAFSTHQKKACIKPAIRKEWRALRAQEKMEWIRAVNCLSHFPHDPALTPRVNRSVSLIPPVNASSSYYDVIGDNFSTDFVYLHMDLSTKIHFTGEFLPWHRWFLYAFEETLKYSPQCLNTHYSQMHRHFFESSFWKDSNPESGLGGWGDPKADYSVPDGGFRKLHLSYPSPHISTSPLVVFTDPSLEANTTCLAPAVEKILEIPDYKSSRRRLKLVLIQIHQGPHGAVHLIVGADLAGNCPQNASNCIPGTKWSPNGMSKIRRTISRCINFLLQTLSLAASRNDRQNMVRLAAPQTRPMPRVFFGGSVEALQSVESYNKYPTGAPPFLNLSSVMPADGLFPEVAIGDVMDTTSGIYATSMNKGRCTPSCFFLWLPEPDRTENEPEPRVPFGGSSKSRESRDELSHHQQFTALLQLSSTSMERYVLPAGI
ncbi:Di-copper centre-containing protein [Lactarius hengduanensis]|nr:Di-copper centre-containing protein [Lactarius hengduanensis]